MQDTTYDKFNTSGCSTTTNTLASCNYIGYTQSQGLYDYGQQKEAESFLAPKWGCSSVATGNTTIDSGILVHTYDGCTSGPHNPVEIQTVSIPTSCHSDSCVGSDGYSIARSAWEFWTTGTKSPS